MPFIHLYSLKHCVFLFVVQYSKFLSYLCETSSYSLFFHSLSFYRSRIPLFFIPLLSYHHSLRYNHWLQQISKTVLRAFVHKFDDDDFQRGQREGRDLAAHKILALFRGIYVRSTLYKVTTDHYCCPYFGLRFSRLYFSLILPTYPHSHGLPPFTFSSSHPLTHSHALLGHERDCKKIEEIASTNCP